MASCDITHCTTLRQTVGEAGSCKTSFPGVPAPSYQSNSQNQQPLCRPHIRPEHSCCCCGLPVSPTHIRKHAVTFQPRGSREHMMWEITWWQGVVFGVSQWDVLNKKWLMCCRTSVGLSDLHAHVYQWQEVVSDPLEHQIFWIFVRIFPIRGGNMAAVCRDGNTTTLSTVRSGILLVHQSAPLPCTGHLTL